MVVSVKAADIAAALFAHLDKLGVPTAYPNRTFTPPQDGQYLAAAFMPNRPGSDMIRFEDENEQRGLMQVSVYWPLNAGIVALQRRADTIIAHFARGTVIAADGFAVRVIEDPWSSPPLMDDRRAMVPVTIPWRAF